MRVFLTGGSGFVGGHVIEGLAPEHEVLAMARSERSAAKVEAYGATPVRCALGEVPADALAGVDVVIHAAAYVEEYGPREAYWSANVDGTQQLLDVAREAGVSRFILVGTESVLFDDNHLVAVTEATPVPSSHRFFYSESKAEAERRVLGANGPGFTTLSLRPSFIWGPRDATILPALKRMVDDGAFLWLDGGRVEKTTTHVANLVHALQLALTAGRGGEAYFVNDGVDSSVRDFLTRLAEAEGFSLPSRSVPGAVARLAARVLEGGWRLLGKTSTPPLTYFAVAMLSRTATIHSDKAKDELGYEPVVSVDEGMAGLGAQGTDSVG